MTPPSDRMKQTPEEISRYITGRYLACDPAQDPCKSCELFNEIRDAIQAERDAKDAQIKKLREALEFYAHDAWSLRSTEGFISEDGGRRARQAIAEDEVE